MNGTGLKNDDVRVMPGAEGKGFAAGAVMTWAASGIVAIAISVFLMKVIFKGIMPVELMSGFGLALANSAVALMITITAMRKKREGFVALGTAGNVLRAVSVLVIILFVRLSEIVRFEPFVAAFLAGYLVFMIAEIIRLNRLSMRSRPGA